MYLTGDQIIISEDKDELSYMVRKLQDAYERNGLTINKDKSEYIVFKGKQLENLPLEGNQEIRGVNKCK